MLVVGRDSLAWRDRLFRNACLVELKDRYDPANLFRPNRNIRPSQSTAVPALV